MKKGYTNGVLFFILVLTLFFSWRSFAQDNKTTISIKKAFHHKGQQTNGASGIEAGSLVFYFSAIPSLMPVAHVAYTESSETQTFFLPWVTITPEGKRMIDRITADNTQPYSIKINTTRVPNKGVEIVISYPRNAYALESKKFEAIGGDKGLIFYIYNQKMLDSLRACEQPLMKMACNGRHPPCVFIDSGHGGSDTGAVGYGDVKEKDICLQVGAYLAQLLEKNGYTAIRSRIKDQDVSLDQRTTNANRSKADIFISIHANSAGNDKVYGVETFCMRPSLLTRFYSKIDKTSSGFTDTIIAQRSEQSSKLAQLVQHHICTSIASYQKNGYDRGVKHAVAQVFFSQMPTILVELGFLTNSNELQLLTTDSYQKLLAKALFQGIHDYFRSTKNI